MSAEPHPSGPDQSTAEDPRLTAYLYELLEIGAKVARNVGHQADQPAPESQPPHPTQDLAEQFERVSRAMRRTILLIRHIAQPRANPAQQRTQARKRIIREVEDAIGNRARDPESLAAEFRERLDAPDLDDEIANRPIPEIILDIRRDLGLEDFCGVHPFQRRTPRTLEALTVLAATPRPPGPYTPSPHGPDPGAPKPKRAPHPPDNDHQQLIELAKLLSGT